LPYPPGGRNEYSAILLQKEIDSRNRTTLIFFNFGLDNGANPTLKGKNVTILNMAEDPRAQYPKAAIEEGIVSLVSIPLSIEGRIIGVLRIYTGAPRNFSEDEINFAEALAEMGAIAIRNARVHEGLQEDFLRVVDLWSAELNK